MITNSIKMETSMNKWRNDSDGTEALVDKPVAERLNPPQIPHALA